MIIIEVTKMKNLYIKNQKVFWKKMKATSSKIYLTYIYTIGLSQQTLSALCWHTGLLTEHVR